MKGLVIEVNGPVHDYEPKMVKDENRVAILAELGIAVVNIENADIDSPSIRNLITQIKSMPRLNWRAKQRLHNRVRAWTIIANNSLFYGDSNEHL